MTKLKFCPSCGHKFDYKFAAPKFCSNCGEAVAAQSPFRGEVKPSPRIGRRPADIDESDVDEVPQIDELKATVEFDSNVLTMDYNDKEGFAFKKKKFEKRNTSF